MYVLYAAFLFWPSICPYIENVKFYWKLLWTARTYTHTFLNLIECRTYGCLTKAPSSLSSLAAMQIDDDLPVHLNVYISLFKQWWLVKKYKNILLVLLKNPFP